MIFTKETHRVVFDGYIIIDCVVKEANRQVYILVEDNDEKIKDGYLPEYRFLYTYNEKDDPNKRFYSTGRTHLNNPKLCYNDNGGEIIALDMKGQFFSQAGMEFREEDKLSQKLEGSTYNAVYSNIRTIGDSMYAIGEPHLLLKRNGVNDWENISKSIPLPKAYLDDSLTGSEDFGWNDLDGFSEQDMYLGGGDGEVWQFDGTNFKQCDFPSNEPVENVCCAGDGYVYIGGRGGRLWKGKGDKWELISGKEFSVDWKDIEWFDNRLFLGSDYGLWELKGNEIIRAEVPLEVKSCAGSLSICPEKKHLLTASHTGASMYDGNEWTVLFDAMDLPD